MNSSHHHVTVDETLMNVSLTTTRKRFWTFIENEGSKSLTDLGRAADINGTKTPLSSYNAKAHAGFALPDYFCLSVVQKMSKYFRSNHLYGISISQNHVLVFFRITNQVVSKIIWKNLHT